MKTRTTAQMMSCQVVHLLRLGDDYAEPEHSDIEALRDKAFFNQVTGELLQDALAGMLPLDSATVETLPLIAGPLPRELAPLQGKPVARALLDRRTDVETIRRVKEYWKRVAYREEALPYREPEHAVAIVLYFAAIASALVYHKQKMTNFGYGDLAESLQTLARKPWLTPDLKQLFAKAATIGKKRSR